MKRYSNIPIKKTESGIRMYTTTRYPDIPRSFEDIYIYTTAGDRFDTLAQEYYGDSSLWWIISIANDNLNQNSLTPPVGSQIRIPSDYSNIISRFKVLNK